MSWTAEDSRAWRERNPEKVAAYNQRAREWWKLNPEKVAVYRQRQKEWRKRNPEKVAAYIKSHQEKAKKRTIERKYGITYLEFSRMVQEQNGLCAICCVAPATHVDHCHETKKIRGVLCNNCNVGLGFFKDNVSSLQNAIKYLAKYEC